MKKLICGLAVILSGVPAIGQGILTPDGLTRAGAGGPVSGTIPHGLTYPSPPPVNNAGVNSQPATPLHSITGNTSQAIDRIPVIQNKNTKERIGRKRKNSSAGANHYDLGIGETPSIMIEDKPKH